MDLIGALTELAALLEVESSARSALGAWHEAIADKRDASVLRAVARRIHLGAPIDTALVPLVDAAGPEASALIDAARTHATAGASLATSVRGIASAIEARRALAHEGRAASAAASLSGRMLALLAGASLLLTPMSRGLTPGAAVATTAAASLLAWAGLRWMRKLSPRPPHDDPVAARADVLAALVRAGVQLRAAMDLIGRDSTELESSRRLVALGMSWPDAIAASGDRDDIRLAAVLRRGQRLGIPVAAALTALAAGIRERDRRTFELHARRTPVLLVAPVALCLLPAFAIVVMVPLLRGLSV